MSRGCLYLFHDMYYVERMSAWQVFSIFLDTLAELCMVHARDLTDWLYVLLTRLLNKTGTDMLGSVNAKLLRTLDTVRSVGEAFSSFGDLGDLPTA